MPDDIPGMMGEMKSQIVALMISGAAGAYVRAIFAPEARLRRRLLEGSAGALGAIFLGGFVAHQIDRLMGGGDWAYLAAGFVMGEGGILSIRAVRRIVFKEDVK